MADPLGELLGIGDGGWQEDVVDIVRQEDDGLLPYYTTVWNGKEGNLMSHLPNERTVTTSTIKILEQYHFLSVLKGEASTCINFYIMY